MCTMDLPALTVSIYKTLLDLACDDGINASGKHEVYGCIFGRDSAITILKILKALKNKNYAHLGEQEILQNISKKALIKLTHLQGKDLNIESGEQPGKFIHEYRTKDYDRLTRLEKPWYVYPDGILRNYDSVDATPLGLIAIYKYYKLTQDSLFLQEVLPAVEKGLRWILDFADLDKDYVVEYELPLIRKYGGLSVQSWTDSHVSLLTKEGTMPQYPIAPVEVQGYVWLALRLWSDFFLSSKPFFAEELLTFAKNLKEQFNKNFILFDDGYYFAAQALDGAKKQIATITGNPALLLYATYTKGKREVILEDAYVDEFVARTFQPDLFDPSSGIRTMSSKAHSFNPRKNSYHNGSFWPKLNGMIHEGLENWGYTVEAELLKMATIKPIQHFQSPIELYIRDESGYQLYEGQDGQKGCLTQAWSAAVALDLLTL